jgi:hypothetical protein
MGKIAKREINRSKTRADGLEVFETGFYRLQDVFECKSAGRNDVDVRKLLFPGKTSKRDFGQSEMSAKSPGVFEKRSYRLRNLFE